MQNDSRVIEKESSIKVNRKIDPTPVQVTFFKGSHISNSVGQVEKWKRDQKWNYQAQSKTWPHHPSWGDVHFMKAPSFLNQVEKSAESDKSKSLTDNKENWPSL